jgi:hypothetical protein
LREGWGSVIWLPRKTADAKFRLASNSFDVSDAAANEIAAVRHGWRDFRIAP